MSKNECIICAETIDEINNTHNILKCEHNLFFHKQCLDDWTKMQSDNNQILACPICRTEYGDTERINQETIISPVDNSILFDILKFNRYRMGVMFFTSINAMLSIINAFFGNILSLIPFFISMLGFLGAKTLQKCWLLTYIVFNLVSLLVQASIIPHIISKFNQDTWIMYCIGIAINLFILIYIIIFYRQVSLFRSRMESLRDGVQYNYINIP